MKLSDAIKAIDYDPSPNTYPFKFRGKYHGTTSLLFAIGNEAAQLESDMQELIDTNARLNVNYGQQCDRTVHYMNKTIELKQELEKANARSSA